jgi:hypothetical protein
MTNQLQDVSQQSIKQPVCLKISARKQTKPLPRITQGHIFQNIEIIENITVDKSIVKVDRVQFPFVVCLNQECDLENDFNQRTDSIPKDNSLLHLAIAPAFIFDQYLTGNHWGAIFQQKPGQRRKDTIVKNIMDNEIPRFHYLKFPDADMPELIIDFKHFFTINRDYIYQQMDKRLCSIEDLFKEKISQRFSYYISRIGLPLAGEPNRKA